MGDADNFTTRLKELEMIILKNKTLLETGYEFSDEALTRYVESITDPKSILYVGAQNVYNENSFLQGMMLDNVIASASNSDLLIASTTMMLKNAEARANQAVQNSMVAMGFDRLRANALKKYNNDV